MSALSVYSPRASAVRSSSTLLPKATGTCTTHHGRLLNSMSYAPSCMSSAEWW